MQTRTQPCNGNGIPVCVRRQPLLHRSLFAVALAVALASAPLPAGQSCADEKAPFPGGVASAPTDREAGAKNSTQTVSAGAESSTGRGADDGPGRASGQDTDGALADLPDCFEQLLYERGDRITCTFPVRMTEAERDKIREISRDLFVDAACTMQIDIDRERIDAALVALNHTFEAPPQPVMCDVETSRKTFPVAFTFAPRLVIKDGQAVEGSPGMGAVTGVYRLLSWPVKTWINSSDEIEEAIVRVYNKFRERFPGPSGRLPRPVVSDGGERNIDRARPVRATSR